MKKIIKIGILLSSFVSCILGSSNATAMEVYNKDDKSLAINGRLQILGQAVNVPNETIRKSFRTYTFMPQSRLGVTGKIDDWTFYSDLAFGGENANTSNVSLALLDFRFDIPVFMSGIYVRAGQYKVFNSREWATGDGDLQFVDRSIAHLGTNFGRDVGVTLTGKLGKLSGAFGIFTSAGQDVPVRWIPQDLGVPLTVLRVGVDTTDDDVLGNKVAGRFKVDETQMAFYLSTSYMEDSLVGHSTALNARAPFERGLIGNPNWNPYLTSAGGGYKKSVYQTAGLDAQYRTMMGESLFSAEFQLGAQYFSNEKGSIRTYDARLQSSLAKKPYEYAFRMAALVLDPNMTYGKNSTAATAANIKLVGGDLPIYEITPAFTWWMKDWSKLIVQASMMFNVPVSVDSTSGTYVSVQQPDNTGYVGSQRRETVFEGQLMWQIQI